MLTPITRMPFGDGTGPRGMGPGTGRGMGPCMAGDRRAGRFGAMPMRRMRRDRAHTEEIAQLTEAVRMLADEVDELKEQMHSRERT